MQISDIVQKIYKGTHTNSTDYPAADMLIDINNAYDRAVSKAIKANTRWQWSDSNNTDQDIATTTITANQRDYTLATSHLKLLRARVKDTSGNWQVLKGKDVEDSDYVSIMDSSTTGIPSCYDKMGMTVLLGLIPNYTQAASLELTFQRGPAKFTSAEVSTGTKEPGFNSLYHELIPLWVIVDYWLAEDPSMATGFLTKINLLEAEMVADYAGRDKDEKSGLQITRENNK